jgi:hypothetical protein
MTSPIVLPPYRAVADNGTDEELSDAAELVGRVVSFMLHNGLQVCGVAVVGVEREQRTGRPMVVYRVPTAAADSKCPLDAIGFLYVGDYHDVAIGEHAILSLHAAQARPARPTEPALTHEQRHAGQVAHILEHAAAFNDHAGTGNIDAGTPGNAENIGEYLIDYAGPHHDVYQRLCADLGVQPHPPLVHPDPYADTPAGPVCRYGRTASCRTPCSGPVTKALVWRSPRNPRRVLSREDVCNGHAAEAMARPATAGAMRLPSLEDYAPEAS